MDTALAWSALSPAPRRPATEATRHQVPDRCGLETCRGMKRPVFWDASGQRNEEEDMQSCCSFHTHVTCVTFWGVRSLGPSLNTPLSHSISGEHQACQPLGYLSLTDQHHPHKQPKHGTTDWLWQSPEFHVEVLCWLWSRFGGCVHEQITRYSMFDRSMDAYPYRAPSTF